jgi:hypothetical protein
MYAVGMHAIMHVCVTRRTVASLLSQMAASGNLGVTAQQGLVGLAEAERPVIRKPGVVPQSWHPVSQHCWTKQGYTLPWLAGR